MLFVACSQLGFNTSQIRIDFAHRTPPRSNAPLQRLTRPAFGPVDPGPFTLADVAERTGLQNADLISDEIGHRALKRFSLRVPRPLYASHHRHVARLDTQASRRSGHGGTRDDTCGAGLPEL